MQRGPAILGLTAPAADVPPGFMRLEWRSDTARERPPAQLLGARNRIDAPGAEVLFNFTDYPTVDVDDPEAMLSVRTAPDAEPDRSPGNLAIHR